MKLPWVKWFPADWLADAEVGKCSLTGRGLWIEALNAMYNSDTFALSGSPEELARVLRCTVAEFHAGIEALAKTNAACHTERNGIVTLLSRRLERTHKSREYAKLRKQRSRQKKPCHTEVPSASASASASSTGERGAGGRGEEREVELPHGFPKTEQEASVQAPFVGCSEAFAVQVWHKALSRGGADSKGLPIRNWRSYLHTDWTYEQARNGHQKKGMAREIKEGLHCKTIKL